MDLPLRTRTPDAWGHSVLSEPLALLSDHAYLERKAASNALELLNRWPEPEYPKDWTTMLAGIARDEAAHLNSVNKILLRRGGRLERLHRCDYAADLRGLVRQGRNREELVDRLLVSALIEARSCERFDVLRRTAGDRELKELYDTLWASEHGHHRLFLRLAAYARPEEEVNRRWEEMLSAEAKIIQKQKPGPRIHSGLPV